MFIVTYGPRKRKLTVTSTPPAQSEAKLFTDDELKGANDWQGHVHDSTNLMSATAVLGNYTTQSSTSSAFESGILDLRRIHNVYISSTNLSTFKTLGPRCESGIIKKCPVTTEHGFTRIDNVVVRHDWIDVSRQLLKTLEFRISVAYGTNIDVRGMPNSFSLSFMLQSD